MATRELTNYNLPVKLSAELEVVASAQGRPVSDLLAEAVRKYLDDRSWQRIIHAGRQRAIDLGLTEDDVPRLIAETRSQQRNE